MPIDDRINTSGTQTDRVSEDWSKAASSFNMLEQHLQQPSQKLDLGYDPIIGGIGPMFEQNLPFLNELSTATDFDDGEFRANPHSSFIFREEIDIRITSFAGAMTLLEFWAPYAFLTYEHSLTCLTSLKSNQIQNI